MFTIDQFLLSPHVNREFQIEIQEKRHTPLINEKTLSHETVEDRSVHFSGGSLLLGLGEDGLPLMLDLYNSATGPLLVAGDRGSGKTALLKSLARVSDEQNPGEIQFGVITPFPEEWTEQEALSNCLGIWPAYHPAAKDFLKRLIGWADSPHVNHPVVLVLVDGLDLLAACDFQIQHELLWLLLYGPKRHIWPVVTVNPGRLSHLQTWIDYFKARILGQVKRPQTHRLLIKAPEINLATLEAGTQFCFSSPDGRWKFRLP
jgi:energy-coupling factor transporter ATP-binding protein EcfA2